MQITATLVFIFIMIGFGAIIMAYFWPSIALGMFFVIPLVKPNLVMHFNFLTGTVGYIFDTSIVIIAILAIIMYLIKTGQSIRNLIPISFWICWFILSMLVWLRLPASRDPVTGFQRAMLFSVYNTLVLILGAVCGSNPKSASKVVSVLLVVGLMCTFAQLLFGTPSAEYEAARITVGGAQVLALGDSIAYAIIVIITFWLSKRRYFLRKPAFILAGFALFAILLAGHRGAIVGLTLVFLFIAIAYRKAHGIWSIASGLILALIIGFVVNYFFTTKAQAGRFTKERFTEAVYGRVYKIKSTLSEWSRSPVFGTGTGDMSFQLTGMVGEKEYPHNIYLEVLNEFGIVGFVFYMALFVHTLRIFKTALSYQSNSLVQREILVVLMAGLVYHILFGIKTSSYAGSFMLYFFMGTGLSLAKFSRQQESLELEQAYYDMTDYDMTDLQQDYSEL